MKLTLALALLVLATGPAAAASTTAATYAGGGSEFTFGSATGFFFTPTTSLSVGQLGLYDLGAPGFTDSHEIGLFHQDGTLVASVSLGAGLSGTLIDGSRFVSIAPVTLAAGAVYYIVADNFLVDQYAFGPVVYAPQVTWLGFGDAASNSVFSPVNNLGGVPGNLGPNFRFDVPEPAIAGLLGLAFALGLLARR